MLIFFGKVLLGELGVADLEIGDTEVVVCLDEMGVELESLAIVGNGLVILALGLGNIAEIVVGEGEVGVELEGMFEGSLGLVDILIGA